MIDIINPALIDGLYHSADPNFGYKRLNFNNLGWIIHTKCIMGEHKNVLTVVIRVLSTPVVRRRVLWHTLLTATEKMLETLLKPRIKLPLDGAREQLITGRSLIFTRPYIDVNSFICYVCSLLLIAII